MPTPKKPFQKNAANSLLERDPYLKPYKTILHQRLSNIIAAEKRLTEGKITLADFASGHEYFGLHFVGDQWIFREWAPNASQIFLIGDRTQWREKREYALQRINADGVWEIHLP
ncbi:MAG: 1,4-alpha-glucan-branching enzyme, partial [Desulfobacterales bacterium]